MLRGFHCSTTCRPLGSWPRLSGKEQGQYDVCFTGYWEIDWKMWGGGGFSGCTGEGDLVECIERTISAVALFHQSHFGNHQLADRLFQLLLFVCEFVLVGSVDGDVERGAPRVGCTDREGWQEHCTEKDGFENILHCDSKVRALPLTYQVQTREAWGELSAGMEVEDG